MWDEVGDLKDETPRRIDKKQKISELSDQEAIEKFYKENERFIFDY